MSSLWAISAVMWFIYTHPSDRKNNYFNNGKFTSKTFKTQVMVLK